MLHPALRQQVRIRVALQPSTVRTLSLPVDITPGTVAFHCGPWHLLQHEDCSSKRFSTFCVSLGCTVLSSACPSVPGFFLSKRPTLHASSSHQHPCKLRHHCALRSAATHVSHRAFSSFRFCLFPFTTPTIGSDEPSKSSRTHRDV